MLLRTVAFTLLAALSVFIPYVLVKTGVRLYYKGDTVEKVLSHHADADIAVFGSSVAWVHFDPYTIESITGSTCYNFGTNGTSLQQYKGLLKEYLEYSNCKIIVLAGTSGEFVKRQNMYEFERYSEWLGNENIYQSLSAIDFQLTWRTRFVPMYDVVTFDEELYEKFLKGLSGITYVKENNEYKGFSPKNRPWKAKGKEADFVVEIDNDVVRQYQEVIKAANRKGKRVILVLAPIYESGQKQIRNLDEVRATYQMLAGQKNIFFDFTQSDFCSNRSLFYNNTHLNAEGAKLLSEEFSQKLMPYL